MKPQTTEKTAFFVRIFILFILCLGVYPIPVSAQKQLQYYNLTTEKGLAHNWCHVALKDKNGFLWFGTQDGLSRFDGHDVKNFKHSDTDSTSISSNIICGMAADKKGRLWLAVNGGGLNCFDPLSNKALKFDTPLHPITKITGFAAKTVLIDRQERVWMGTFNNGLYAFNLEEKQFLQYDLAKPLEILTDAFRYNSINAMVQDVVHNDWLWLATNNHVHSLYRLNIETKNIESFPIKGAITSIFMDKPNEIWMGTWGNGLSHFNTITQKIEYFGDDMAKLGKDFNTNVITGIARRNKHELWITSLLNGLWIFDEIKKVFYHLPESEASKTKVFGSETEGLFVDKSSNMVYFFDKEVGLTSFSETPAWLQYHPIPECEVVNHNEINNFLWDEHTERLFLTMHGCRSLYVFDKNYNMLSIKGSGYFVFYPTTKKDDNQIYKPFNCLWLNEKTHKIWLGSDFSKDSPYTLIELDPISLTLSPLSIPSLDKLNIHQNAIKHIIQDRQGWFWIDASELGLIRYNPKTQETTIIQNTNHIDILELKEDSKGNIWAATELSGLLQIDEKTTEIKCFRHYRTKSNPKDSIFFDCKTTQEADDGTIWVGTLSHGVIVLDPSQPVKQTVATYNIEQGLPHLYVGNIIKDKNDALWLSTLGGMCYFDQKKKEFHVFNFGESVKDLKMRRKGLGLGANGAILLGFNKDFLSISLDNKEDVQRPNKAIQFTDFKIFEKSISFDKPLNDVAQIDLLPNQNFFTVSFSAMIFPNDKIRYRYKVLGFNDNWIDAGNRNSATYTNLPDGIYPLQVQCTNEEGVWQEQIAELKLNIIPPYYRTWWFRLLAILFMGSLVFAFYKYRMRLFKEKEVIKTSLNKKIAEAKMEALQSQMNPHFIFNALTSINLFILKNDTETASFYLNKFSRLMREVLDHSRSDLITVQQEIYTLKIYVEIEKMRFKNNFNFIFDIEPNARIGDTQIPPLLIQPYVENAIWHGLKHKKDGDAVLKIKVYEDINSLYIMVEDNGVGRKKAMELKKNMGSQHKSHGLNVTQERIKQFNAAYSIEASVETIDLMNDAQQPIGTQIVFKIKNLE